MRGGGRTAPAPPAAVGATLLALALLAVGPALPAAWDAQPARAQEAPEVAPEEEEMLEPPMAEAPREFRASAGGSALLFRDDGFGVPDDGALWSLDVEHLLIRHVGARVGAAFGTSEISQTVEGGGTDTVDLNAWLVEILASPRLSVGPFRKVGVTPFATVGIGSLIHDPDRDDLSTRSQNAFLFGGGVEVEVTHRLGVRGEWRQYSFSLEDVFDPVDRTGTTRDADRLFLTLFWGL